MILRNLSPDTDRELIETAYSWARNTPQWFRDMDATYGPDDFEAYLKASRNGGANIGIFGEKFEGVVILSEQKPQRFECHLMAPRDADFETLAFGGFVLRRRLFEHGAQEICAWIASKNLPLRRLITRMGLQSFGVKMIKGQYRGRVIHWLRYSQNRAQWEGV